MENNSQSGHTSRGKWSQAGVPQRGWTCVDIGDLGEPSQICEMCESTEIRYVHYMQHSNYAETLAVGCVCAEHMEQDYVRPREREKKLQNAARRRKAWAKRVWRESLHGNSYVNVDGFNITVFRAGNIWKVIVRNRATGKEQRGQRAHPTEIAARAAGFDALIWAKEKL